MSISQGLFHLMLDKVILKMNIHKIIVFMVFRLQFVEGRNQSLIKCDGKCKSFSRILRYRQAPNGHFGQVLPTSDD